MCLWRPGIPPTFPLCRLFSPSGTSLQPVPEAIVRTRTWLVGLKSPRPPAKLGIHHFALLSQRPPRPFPSFFLFVTGNASRQSSPFQDTRRSSSSVGGPVTFDAPLRFFFFSSLSLPGTSFSPSQRPRRFCPPPPPSGSFSSLPTMPLYEVF